MAARAVVARDYEFAPRGVAFSDASVAYDEIRALPPPTEPLVLRVTTWGGSKLARERATSLVGGDWLCDASLPEPRRIPGPSWWYEDKAALWSQPRTWLEAWETCQDARWLLHAAAEAGVDPRRVVRAAVACARLTLGLVPAGEDAPRRAVEVAEAWAHRKVVPDGMKQVAWAAEVVGATYEGLAAYAYASFSAANVAYAVENAMRGERWSYALSVADAANASASAEAYAATVVNGDVSAARARALAVRADLVRGEITTLEVLRAVSAA